jgi:hypothetical protein
VVVAVAGWLAGWLADWLTFDIRVPLHTRGERKWRGGADRKQRSVDGVVVAVAGWLIGLVCELRVFLHARGETEERWNRQKKKQECRWFGRGSVSSSLAGGDLQLRCCVRLLCFRSVLP